MPTHQIDDGEACNGGLVRNCLATRRLTAYHTAGYTLVQNAPGSARPGESVRAPRTGRRTPGQGCPGGTCVSPSPAPGRGVLPAGQLR